MKRLYLMILLSLPIALGGIGPVPARADFYKLEGRFQCLEGSAAPCYDAMPMAPEQPATRKIQTAAAEAAPPPQAPPVARRATPRPAPVVVAPRDTMIGIAERVLAKRPAADDLAALRREAAAGNGRAAELLAWCSFAGIGTARDPVQAYLLYGQAAAAGVPKARANQAAIYETVLTQEQRQRVLEIEDNRRLSAWN